MTTPRIQASDEQRYERQIRSNLDNDTITIEDDWWVWYAPAYYEKYYYAQDYRHPLTSQPPSLGTRVVDLGKKYRVTIQHKEPVLINKTIGIGENGYPALQPGLLCTEHKTLWPRYSPCPHINAVRHSLKDQSMDHQIAIA